MKEIKNYKEITENVKIFGLSFMTFVYLIISCLLPILIFSLGITYKHFIAFFFLEIVIVATFYLYNFFYEKININTKKNKLPNELSDLNN